MKIPSLGLPVIVFALGILGYAAFSGLRPVVKPVFLAETPDSGIDFINLSSKKVQSDQALLEDSAPLFLPTRWNASASPRTVHVGIPIYPPELHSKNSPLLVQGPKLPFAPPPSNNISDWLRTPFSTFSLGSNQTSPSGNSGYNAGMMVINRVGGVGDRQSFPIPAELLGKSKTGIWSPVEFFYTIENLTALGLPVQTRFSGAPELDEALSRFVQQKVSGNGFSSGYYHITAYP